MNLFLCDLNKNTNENLNELLNSYQDYFIFIKDKDKHNVSLYLDVNNLKKHLINGIEIKYKKFIFLFLENINDLKKNKNYKFDILFKTISFSKYINININFKKYFDENDNKNLEYILNLNKRYLENKNKISIKDKNIILLDKNFYADLNYNRFYINNYENKKHIFKFNSMLINNISNLKNQIMTLISIKAFDSYKELEDKISNNISNSNINNINNINNKTLFNIENNCVLIISDKYNIDSWKKNINLIFDNLDMEQDVYVINTIAHMSNITNKNIKNLKFLIININILSNLNKIYLNKYSTNDLLEIIKNIIYENSYNINIEYSNFENLFLFHWKNIIIDEINKFIKIELNLFSHLLCKNLKYYLHNEPNINTDIYNYFVKYTISNVDINDNNLYYFINKELIFSNYTSFNNIDNNDKIKFIETELNEEENLIAASYKNNLNINKELSLLFIKSSYDYFVNTNINDIKNKICNTSLNNSNNNIVQLKNKYLDNVITEYNISNKNFCCICMDRIEKNNFCILGCGHYYCKICILIHKINNIENCLCPMCRNKFDVIYNLNSHCDTVCDYNINIDNIDNSDNNIDNNIDNNSDINNENNSNKLKQIIDIINNNNDKKLLLVSDYKEVIKFINQKLIKKYNITILKNNKNYIKSCYIYITELNNLLKHNVYDIDIIIFLDINNINYNIFSKIKIRYDDYFFNIKELKYFIFYVKGFLLDDTIIKKIK
jgi:hypothetical protein